MIQYAPFNRKQVRYYKRALRCWLNVAEGGKRASKNVLNILGFAENLETHPDKLHLAAGVTKATARMNILDSNGFGLEHYFAGRCWSGKYQGVEALYIRTKTGLKVVLIAGGKDSDDFRIIKGFSLGSIYITEANECHQTFVQEALDRTLASTTRKVYFDINPKSPRHWFYKDFLDHQDKLKAEDATYDYNYEHFTIYDNMSISDEKLSETLRSYDKSSLWYMADILGKRTAASGRIYTSWSKSNIINKEQLKTFSFNSFAIGVDIGGTDATVATLGGFTIGHKEVVLIDGYYHKQGKREGMTHSQYAKRIVDQVELWTDRYPRVSSAIMYVESADKLFRSAMREELDKRGFYRIQIVPSYKKDGIVDRIRLQCILVYEDRLYVCDHMSKWIEAYENAVWSDKDYEKGNWVRVDDSSYPVDCLDSSEYLTQPYRDMLVKAGGNVA